MLVFELEVKNPTVHVNITRDMTLGFISKYNDLIKFPKFKGTVFFLIVLDKINLRLLKQISEILSFQ